MARTGTGIAYLLLALVVLGASVFSIFVTVPQFSAYTDSRERVADEKKEVAEMESFLRNLDLRVAELRAQETDAKTLELMLPAALDQKNLLSSIDALATEAGVKIDIFGEMARERQREAIVTNAGRETASEGASVEKWIGTLSGTGTYAQIRSFVEKLEKSVVLVDVDKIRLESKDDPNDDEIQSGIIFDLSFVVYTQKTKK